MYPINDLDAAYALYGHGARLRAAVDAAKQVRARLLNSRTVLGVKSLTLTTLPYPTRYAFGGLASSPIPYVTMTHRALLVQFWQEGVRKNLLFNPTDIEGSRATPFFADFIRMIGKLEPLVAKKSPSLEAQLNAHGLRFDDIDYLAFDHLHTQDLRATLGTKTGAAAKFPNAKLLVQRQEWLDWDDLHPMQQQWYVADGKRDVRTEQLVLLDGDIQLGDGVMLIRTPGHTTGNQTLFLRTVSGVWGCSENGTSADCWSPQASRIPGLQRASKTPGHEVIINSNTPELGASQYTSMMLERTIVDAAGDFVQMLPSSEVTPSLLAPGLSPSLVHGGLAVGEIQPSRRALSVASVSPHAPEAQHAHR